MVIGSAARASSRAAMPTRTSVAMNAQAARSMAVIFSQPSLSLGLGDRNGNPDLTIITLRSRMQRENRVAADIGRDRLFRRRLRLHQLVVVVKRSFHDFV